MQRKVEISRNSKRHLPKLQHWPVLWKQVKWRCVVSQRGQKAQPVVNTAEGLVLAVPLHPSNLRYLGQPPPQTHFCALAVVCLLIHWLLEETPWQVKTAAKVEECGESGCCLHSLGRAAITQLSPMAEAERSMWIGASFDPSLPKLLPLRYVTYLPWARDNCNN